MKNLLLLLFFFMVSSFAYAQKYYVTFIKGKVALARNHQPLKIGDVLSPEDKLLFDSKSSKISCISPGKGRFDLSATEAQPGVKGELFALLKAKLVPASGTNHLSTRSVLFEGYDPVTYFSSPETQDRILLIANEPISIKPSYRLDESNFFFLQYTANGKLNTRKIEQMDKDLIFTEQLLSEVQQLGDLVTLCYQSNTDGKAKSIAITKFYPVGASKDDILKQVELIKAISGPGDQKKQKMEIIGHLYDNYGKIGAEELNRIFSL